MARQPNFSKSFTELSFIVFSICSKACTSTGSSIPREAAVTCASVGSICIITSRTAVTLVTWRTFVDIWRKKNYSLRMFQGIQSTVRFWSFWHISPISIQESLSWWIPERLSPRNKIQQASPLRFVEKVVTRAESYAVYERLDSEIAGKSTTIPTLVPFLGCIQNYTLWSVYLWTIKLG